MLAEAGAAVEVKAEAEAGVAAGVGVGAITVEAGPTAHSTRARADLHKSPQGIGVFHQNVGVDLHKREAQGVPRQMAAEKGHPVLTQGDPQFCSHSNFLVNAFPSVSGEKIRPNFAGRYGDDGS